MDQVNVFMKFATDGRHHIAEPSTACRSIPKFRRWSFIKWNTLEIGKEWSLLEAICDG